MLFVTQKMKGTRNIYYLVSTDTAGIVVNKVPYDCRIKVINDGNKKLIILLDRDGKVRKDVNEYLNDLCASEKYSTRMQRAQGLNLFYLFCDLYAYPPENLTKEMVHQLMNFMLGVSVRPESDGKRTLRHPKTVNTYYCFITKYIKDKEWSYAAFKETEIYRTETTINDVTFNIAHHKDTNKLRVNPLRNTMPPKHLTLEQARALVDETLKDKDITMYLLVRLQIGCGLRSGEALGITIEDIKKRKLPNKDEYHYYIILRNRCSDRPWQHCKTLYQPLSPDEYSKEVYQNTEVGRIDISQDFYNKLMEYIETSWNEPMSPEWRKRMEKDTLADSVLAPTEKNWKPNRYVFLGQNKRCLSGQTYNYRLKKIFNRVGIPVDEGQKQTNCSHKLRHTFAMILTTYGKRKASSQELMLLMRHHSVLSGAAYFTPTEEEAATMREEFTQSIIQLIPELSNQK